MGEKGLGIFRVFWGQIGWGSNMITGAEKKFGAMKRRKKFFRAWARALGQKASTNTREADQVALIRTVIVLQAVITNFVIMAGVVRHWNSP